MRKIVMMNGISQGDTLGGIGRSFEGTCNELGYDFVEINLAKMETVVSDFRCKVLGHKIEFGFGFMGIGSDLSCTDKTGKIGNFWETTSTPFLSFCGDSPAHFFDRHVARSPNFASLYGFPEHLALRKRLPQINGLVGTSPFTALNILHRDELDFKRKASGQLVFLKNTHDPEALRRNWTTCMQPKCLQALQEIASELASNLQDDTANQIDNVVTDYFLERGVDITSLVKLRLFFISHLDHYLRYLKAEMVAKALLDFPVHIRGTGWDNIDFSGKRASYVKDCNYNESRDLIRHSLGLIDMSPNTALAPHDRVLRAYGAYTLCLTNEQEFFRRDLPHHAGFSFRFDPEAIQTKVADVLAHPAYYVDLGIETAECFRNIYPPEVAIGQLIELASLIRLNQMDSRPPGMPDGFIWPPASLT
jgi:hypothetical protein